jgi:hypothetical protein
MKINIEQIPHSEQRYNTVGDWRIDENTITVKVSSELGHRNAHLVAIHELVEAVLCLWHGVKEADVDAWDLEHEEPEPGELRNCPYQKEHQIASIVEQLVAHELDVDWEMYEDQIFRIWKSTREKLRSSSKTASLPISKEE